MFTAGSLSSPYPVRQKLASETHGSDHSLSYTAADRRRLQRLFDRKFAEMQVEGASPGLRETERLTGRRITRGDLDIEQVARAFSSYAYVLHGQTGQVVTPLHLEAAFALMHRRVEAIPRQLDRALVCTMATVALADQGMKVHLVVDNALFIPWLETWALPVFDALGLSVKGISPGASEAQRMEAYAQDVTLVSARECAMDFLRDAARWPERSNPALARLDRITGKRSKLADMLMQGLPCGVFMDLDGALIDQASAPVALTRDAHPMHETEEIKQALEMVQYLERGKHFELTEQGAEIALTELGRRQLDTWAEQLGGNWAVPYLAELMLGIAIVSSTLLHEGTHYRVHRNRIEWLLEDTLVPGMAYYGRAFLDRVLELKEECRSDGQRELVARASYQQIFNRYVHLCGCCHSLAMIDSELRSVYGLHGHSRAASLKPVHYEHMALFGTLDEKFDFLRAQLNERSLQGIYLLVASDEKTLVATITALAELPCTVLGGEEMPALQACLAAGQVLVGLSSVLECLSLSLSEPPTAPVVVIHLDRAPGIIRDRRNRLWVGDSLLNGAEQWLLLSAEDELFAEDSVKGLQSALRLFGKGVGGRLVERRVNRIQKRLAREAHLVRQGLLGQESTMHSLLSFSGRELYE